MQVEGKREALRALSLEHEFAVQAKTMLDNDVLELRQSLASSRSQVALHASV